MVTTLSLVLGLIFLLFFGFKKYVLKNTAFGGGKLVQVLSTNFLAPKKKYCPCRGGWRNFSAWSF